MAKKNKSLPKEVKVEEKANDFKPLVDENTKPIFGQTFKRSTSRNAKPTKIDPSNMEEAKPYTKEIFIDDEVTNND